MNGATIERDLHRFIELHEMKEAMRVQTKQVNKEFKVLTETVKQFLLQQQGNQAPIGSKYGIQLREKIKTCSLNTQLLQEGYSGFHAARGRVVAADETNEYLGFLKALRKTKNTIDHDINVFMQQ